MYHRTDGRRKQIENTRLQAPQTAHQWLRASTHGPDEPHRRKSVHPGESPFVRQEGQTPVRRLQALALVRTGQRNHFTGVHEMCTLASIDIRSTFTDIEALKLSRAEATGYNLGLREPYGSRNTPHSSNSSNLRRRLDATVQRGVADRDQGLDLLSVLPVVGGELQRRARQRQRRAAELPAGKTERDPAAGPSPGARTDHPGTQHPGAAERRRTRDAVSKQQSGRVGYNAQLQWAHRRARDARCCCR